METQPKQLVVIGDSSVYGWGDTEEGGWCNRLKCYWMKSNKSLVVYPLGIRGDGLEKVAKRWQKEWECRGELRRKVPNGLLLCVGINDTARVGRVDGRPQLSTEAFRFGLEELLKKIKKETYVLVMGMTPVNESKMPFAKCLWYSNKGCFIYERLIEECCLELDIPFLPTYSEMKKEAFWTEWIMTDGIHLNSKGHNWIYKKLITWPSLIKWANS